jgi:hypothetical protein
MHFNSGASERGCKGQLCSLTDRELMDIGITRGEIDHVSNHSISSDPLRWMSDIGTLR